ncbi:hypothetical protein OIO90_002565 [Microbotryomycetes sp. JL221]|nr:hypothetical protein OIO90_002565 [Microbotryomycetes sp. JL221]
MNVNATNSAGVSWKTDVKQDNAEASGSKPSPVLPQNYLVEPGSLKPSPLSGTRDLITLFGLRSTYDTFLRPYLPDSIQSATAASNGSSDAKGKSKAVNQEGHDSGGTAITTTAAATGTSGGGIGITLGGVKIGEVGSPLPSDTTKRGSASAGRKLKMDKNYSALVQDVPGRNTIKKDQFLKTLVMNPEFQTPAPLVSAAKAIHHRQQQQDSVEFDSDIGLAAKAAGFDDQVLREAFTLKSGYPIPGFDMLIWESNTEPPGSKKKKKRKHVGDSNSAAAGGNDDDSRRRKKRKGE